MKVRTRVLKGHDDLDAEQSSMAEYHEWVHLGGWVYCDSLGRKNGGYTKWLLVRCNNPDCAGEAMIHEQDMIDHALATA